MASLTLLSPDGLWAAHTPRYTLASLHASRWLTLRAGSLLSRLVNYWLGRVLVLGQTHGRPARMTAEQARATIQAILTSPGFDATLQATATRRYRAGSPFRAPVTVAFGSRDLLLRRQSRHLDQLPSGTNIAALPRCGHVPIADDPSGITTLITASTGVRREPGAGSRQFVPTWSRQLCSGS